MPINKFTSDSCREIAKDIDEALASVAEKHGVIIKRSQGSFSDNHLRLKLEASLVTDDGASINKSMIYFKQHCTEYGLSPEDLGRNFMHKGCVFQIAGMTQRSTKQPFVGVSQKTGKEYTFSPGVVCKGLQ